MNQYLQARADVTAVLKADGMPVTIVRETGKKSDPVTGFCTPGSIDRLQSYGFLKNYSRVLIDGTNILAGDKRLILDASHDLRDGDALEDATGRAWQIVRYEPKAPAGVVISYDVQVRG